MHVIDTQNLEIMCILQPVPWAAGAHVAFTRDGAHARVSVWRDEGAVIVYDVAMRGEVTRLPMASHREMHL